MEAVVHQALGDVVIGDPGLRGNRANVNDGLVSDEPIVAGVEHGIVLAQACCDVVGGEHCRGSGAGQAIGAHHAHIGPRDRQNAGASIGSSRDGRARVCHGSRGLCDLVKGRVNIHLSKRVTGQEGSQVCFSAHGANTWAATTVGDAEGLVQIQVRHVATDVAIAGVTHESVQVGTIDVDLAASLVNSVGDFTDTRLIHTVRRGVSHHESCQVVAVFRDLFLDVVDVDVTALVTRDNDHLHTGQNSTGSVGAVSTGGNQTDRAVSITP